MVRIADSRNRQASLTGRVGARAGADEAGSVVGALRLGQGCRGEGRRHADDHGSDREGQRCASTSRSVLYRPAVERFTTEDSDLVLRVEHGRWLNESSQALQRYDRPDRSTRARLSRTGPPAGHPERATGSADDNHSLDRRRLLPVAARTRLSREEIREMSRDLPPATSDDVSITSDGVRLDSKEKVLAFLAELERERQVGPTSAR